MVLWVSVRDPRLCPGVQASALVQQCSAWRPAHFPRTLATPAEYRTYGVRPHGTAARSHSRGPACLERAPCRTGEGDRGPSTRPGSDGNQPAVSLFGNLLWQQLVLCSFIHTSLKIMFCFLRWSLYAGHPPLVRHIRVQLRFNTGDVGSQRGAVGHGSGGSDRCWRPL